MEMNIVAEDAENGMPLIVGALLLALLLSATALACPRDAGVRRQFQSAHPCPANGHRSGACPGWVADHVVALCVGGRDAVSNLQWQTVAAAKLKDKWECRRR